MLCNNGIDTEYEHFDDEALDYMKMGVLGHICRSYRDLKLHACVAKIYDCQIKKIDRLTKYGAPYKNLVAKFYAVIELNSENFIKSLSTKPIEPTRITVGVEDRICSICGNDLMSASCPHIEGNKYDNRLCYGVLSNIIDFDECTLTFKENPKVDDDKSMIRHEINEHTIVSGDTFANNVGNFVMPFNSKWHNIVKVLIKNGYAVRAYKNECNYIYINYSGQ